ncbi:hypothetical protein [Bradyrhizobium sp.]|jgi:hypothetical protein|uniref:hypothetical protein n=1 Tax=Bradyrhizobium sp. TaxID=376 RepID=UPI003C1D5946
MARRLELHIEELALHGFASRDRHRVGDALQAELERQFAAQDLSWLGDKSIAVARLSCAAIKSAPGAPPNTIGAALARGLHRGLSRSAANGFGAAKSGFHRGVRTG